MTKRNAESKLICQMRSLKRLQVFIVLNRFGVLVSTLHVMKVYKPDGGWGVKIDVWDNTQKIGAENRVISYQGYDIPSALHLAYVAGVRLYDAGHTDITSEKMRADLIKAEQMRDDKKNAALQKKMDKLGMHLTTGYQVRYHTGTSMLEKLGFQFIEVF